MQTRHRQGFTCGWRSIGACDGGAVDDEQAHMVGSLPFIPDASEMQLEEGMMGSKESDAIIAARKELPGKKATELRKMMKETVMCFVQVVLHVSW